MEVCEFLMVVRVVEVDGEFLFDEGLDVHEEFVFFRCAVGDGEAGGASTAGAADAVDV